MRWAAIAILLFGLSTTADATSRKRPAIKAEPNKFTDDPVVGRGDRINGEEVQGLVAFTFDDGPNPDTTPAVLDALKQYDIPATFFVVTRRLLGKVGEKSRELLARQMSEGHLVESHSVTHAHLGKADAKKLDFEMNKSFEMLSNEAKRPVGMFRAPFGALGGAGRVRLRQLGVTEVFWSIDTLDWKAKHADKLRKKVLAMILKQKGGVVLMHDVKPITAKIVAEVFDDLEAENCRRLAAKEEPIWPVSIHYFLRDGKAPRAVPDEVAKRTEAYKKGLPERCAKRPAPEPATTPAAATASAPPAAAGSPAPAK
ncbi:MAG TPA: polysaccharide deacetylase family protein [Kofleriaceae bacterium]|nr:polysaccharide deacetylase family protein [Kofleriaceae bacterium]